MDFENLHMDGIQTPTYKLRKVMYGHRNSVYGSGQTTAREDSGNANYNVTLFLEVRLNYKAG